MVVKDNTLKKNKFSSSHKDYNLKNILLSEGKIDQKFLEQINLLKLEELICLKLIQSASSLSGKIYNFPIFKFTNDICKEAIYKFALSMSKNRKEASLILGLKKIDIINYIKSNNLEEEFKNVSKSKKNK